MSGASQHAPHQAIALDRSRLRTCLCWAGQVCTDKEKTMYAKLEALRSHIASGNIECVYVWITKEKDTDEACYYRFDAEIYASAGEQSERLQPVKSESGLMKVDKTRATGKLIGNDENSLLKSIVARILLELKGKWRKGEFPNAKFLTYCNIGG
jgi:hypothetical protein